MLTEMTFWSLSGRTAFQHFFLANVPSCLIPALRLQARSFRTRAVGQLITSKQTREVTLFTVGVSWRVGGGAGGCANDIVTEGHISPVVTKYKVIVITPYHCCCVAFA